MLDGKTRKATIDDIHAGVILRDVQSDGTSPPFSDMVVTEVERPVGGNVYFQVLRPYASARERLRFEQFNVHIMKDENEFKTYHNALNYHIVLDSTGKPYMMDY